MKYKVVTLLDICSPVLQQHVTDKQTLNELPKVLKAVIKSKEGLSIKYIETQNIQIGVGTVFSSNSQELIKLSEVSLETQTIYVKDKKLIEELVTEKRRTVKRDISPF
ncbi:hypothetical protein NEFER03_0596 [Nematocida sp. LUAm3]|nr:hypothetical protein NEFER03_0596 [Nematocida sp. LUAm3]KAI5175563.1 hypothetical protein NEFER02_1469 [Nematocida sp. LUAm2]KAI5178407.1 hypothetical protein NEFER01_1554 [Nematocida sp. LUAm1]